MAKNDNNTKLDNHSLNCFSNWEFVFSLSDTLCRDWKRWDIKFYLSDNNVQYVSQIKKCKLNNIIMNIFEGSNPSKFDS